MSDSRLDAYVRLTERELRCVLEPARGMFIAESAKVIERALDAGMVPESFLLTEHWLSHMQPLFERIDPRVPIFVAPQDLMETLCGYQVTRGALAAMKRPPLEDPRELISRLLRDTTGPVRLCVLEGIVDHTNVGAIFRSAAALHVDAILISPTCCDPLYRRAVRVSMGTVFQIPWTRIGSTATAWPDDGLALLHEEGFTCASLALSDDSISLDDPVLTKIDRLALFLGTEGGGLCSKTIAGSDYTVRIPMANGVDSLNVAAASAVVFWQLCPHGSNDYIRTPGLYS
nr:RNA methyltransferase [Collinsella urealyticum]